MDEDEILHWLLSHLEHDEIENIDEEALDRMVKEGKTMAVLFCKLCDSDAENRLLIDFPNLIHDINTSPTQMTTMMASPKRCSMSLKTSMTNATSLEFNLWKSTMPKKRKSMELKNFPNFCILRREFPPSTRVISRRRKRC